MLMLINNRYFCAECGVAIPYEGSGDVFDWNLYSYCEQHSPSGMSLEELFRRIHVSRQTRPEIEDTPWDLEDDLEWMGWD
jgi:hypothetical protein